MGKSKVLTRRRRWFSFAFVFIVANYVGASLLYQAGVLSIFREYKSAIAVVVRSSVEERAFTTADSSFMTGMEGTGWCPRIEYKYEVNGQEYLSNRYQPKVHCQSKRAAEDLISNYLSDSQVQVWYSKNDPQYAVINKDIQAIVFVFYGGVIILWLLGNFMAIKQLTAPNKALQPTPKIEYDQKS
jgi:Protein of unknown function (DUF3592)